MSDTGTVGSQLEMAHLRRIQGLNASVDDWKRLYNDLLQGYVSLSVAGAALLVDVFASQATLQLQNGLLYHPPP